jgi:very-short-patch-repair endonuclease
VVVGDPQQLPPSKFFAASTGSGDGDEEDDDASDLESILDLASATFRPKRRLRWHYRSRHGSLIAFSNRNFYEDDLVVFPSPTERMEGAGVTTRFVEDGAYRNRTNLPEAQAVCREALRFIRANPNRSLGIVAINAVQAQLIRDEMDRVFSENPDAEEWRLSWEGTLEPFICKALEMIQGDERDAIFISTVYGKNADGKVSNNFGEINKAAGHRRLNVLFTRAKHAVRLFTSLRPEDVRLTEKTPRGTRMLHEYLRFAQSGKLDGGAVTDREPDSDFEVMVAEMLRARGFEVVPQVGVSGFRIDLAVRDQDIPGGFLAGIECDGATYHSSKSARDRDRLRQEVLEGLGWTIYRIWSTDWYRDPRREADKAAAFLEDLRRTRKTPDHALFRPFAETVPEAQPSGREKERAPTAPGASVSVGAAQSMPSSGEAADTFSRDLFSAPRTAQTTVAAKASPSLQEKLGALAAEIDREVGAVPVERHILRPEVRDIFIRKMPESASQFRTVVPLAMREKIEPRHMRYLEEILDTLAD